MSQADKLIKIVQKLEKENTKTSWRKFKKSLDADIRENINKYITVNTMGNILFSGFSQNGMVFLFPHRVPKIDCIIFRKFGEEIISTNINYSTGKVNDSELVEIYNG